MRRIPVATTTLLRFALRAWTPILVCVAITGVGSGCRKSETPYVPVSGIVTLDGRPLADAAVSFWSDTDEFSGYTDSNGFYQLKPGAIPATYRVYVRKYDAGPKNGPAFDPGAVGRRPAAPKNVQPPKQLISARYSDPQKTPLRFTVAAPGADRANFDLIRGK